MNPRGGKVLVGRGMSLLIRMATMEHDRADRLFTAVEGGRDGAEALALLQKDLPKSKSCSPIWVCRA